MTVREKAEQIVNIIAGGDEPKKITVDAGLGMIAAGIILAGLLIADAISNQTLMGLNRR